MTNAHSFVELLDEVKRDVTTLQHAYVKLLTTCGSLAKLLLEQQELWAEEEERGRDREEADAPGAASEAGAPVEGRR